MRLLLFFFFFISFLNAWQDAPCTVPDGKVVELDRQTLWMSNYGSNSCADDGKYQYKCNSDNFERILWKIKPDSECNNGEADFKIYKDFFNFVDDTSDDNDTDNDNSNNNTDNNNTDEETVTYLNCGDDAHESNNACVCNNTNFVYHSSDKTCGCPDGQSYNGDYCEDDPATCNPLDSSFAVTTFTQSECTKSNLQNLYNQNNNDGRIISSVTWHCDNKCYYQIQDNPNSNDNNNTDNNNSTIPANPNDIVGAINYASWRNHRDLEYANGYLLDIRNYTRDLRNHQNDSSNNNSTQTQSDILNELKDMHNDTKSELNPLNNPKNPFDFKYYST